MKFKTKTAEFSFDERGFIVVKFLDNYEIFDATEALEHIRIAKTLVNNKKHPILADITASYHVPDAEAKKILAEFEFKSAEAIVVATLAHKILCNFYIKVLKTCNANYPVKVFMQKEKAIEWLLNPSNE